MSSQNFKYDYIIAGAGCAGLSLVYRILQQPTLKNKKILIIDQDSKQKNDRTWCFWEKENGLFQDIVTHEWNSLIFKNEEFTNTFDLTQYSYKMIKGIDFYHFVFNYLKDFANVTFLQDKIINIDVTDNKANVKTSANTFTAEYVFNSTSLFNPALKKENTLLQHFLGWEIELNTPIFDDKIGTLMDFSLNQKHGTTFMYVLPTSSTKALVEYTLFTEEVLPKDEYRKAISGYINNDLGIHHHTVTHEEYGVIPMTLEKFPNHHKERIINIGTAGGFTKASSGYTFQFIQKYTNQIVNQLANQQKPTVQYSFRDKMFQWYDRTLLDVLLTNSMSGKDVFSTMFKKTKPEIILSFLDNDSSLKEDFLLITKLPFITFLRSGIRQLFK